VEAKHVNAAAGEIIKKSNPDTRRANEKCKTILHFSFCIVQMFVFLISFTAAAQQGRKNGSCFVVTHYSNKTTK